MRLPFLRKSQQNSNLGDEVEVEEEDSQRTREIYEDVRPNNRRRLTEILGKTLEPNNRIDTRIKWNEKDGDINEDYKLTVFKATITTDNDFKDKTKKELAKKGHRLKSKSQSDRNSGNSGNEKVDHDGDNHKKRPKFGMKQLYDDGDDYSDDREAPVLFHNLPREVPTTLGPVIPNNLVPITGEPIYTPTTGLPLFWVPFASFGGLLLLVLVLVCLYCFCFKKKKAGGLTPDKSSSTTSMGLKNQMLTVEVPSSKNQDVTVQKVNGENVMVIKECNPNSSEPTVTTISESAPDSKGIVNVTIVKETMVKVPHKEPGEQAVKGSKSNLGPGLVRLSQTQLVNARSKLSNPNGSKSRL